MAKIPDENSLGARPIPSPNRGVVSVRTGLAEAGNRRAGAIIQSVGETITRTAQEWQDRKDGQAYIQAQSQFLRDKISAENNINDDEYSTYSSRFSEAVTASRDSSAAKIRNNFLRDKFVAETQVDILRGVVVMNEKAKAKEGDIGRANLTTIAESNLDALSRSTDELTRTRILNSTNEAIELAFSNGWIDKEQAEDFRKKFGAQYAVNRLLSMSPEEQTAVLEKEQKTGGTFAQFIPTGKRLEILEKAKKITDEKGKRAKAQNKTAELQERFPDNHKARIGAARKEITDPELKDEVVRRLDNERVREAQFEKDEHDNLVEGLADSIAEGGSIYDIPEEQVVKLSQAERSNLISLEEVVNGTKPVSEEEFAVWWDKFSDDIAQDEKNILKYETAELFKFLHNNEAEMKKFIALRNAVKNEPSAVHVPAVEGQKNTLISGWLDSIGLSKKSGTKARSMQRQRARNAFEARVQALREINEGKMPSVTELQSIADDLSVKWKFNPPAEIFAPSTWFGRTEKFPFEITGDEDLMNLDIRIEGARVPREDLERIISVAREQFPERVLTPEDVKELAEKWIERFGRRESIANPKRNF